MSKQPSIDEGRGQLPSKGRPPSPPPAPPLPRRAVNEVVEDSPARDALARLVRRAKEQPKAHLSPERAQGGSRAHRRAVIQDHVTHKTSIPIASLDISPEKTRAVLAGREILKIIRVTDESCVEEQNLRASIAAFASTHERAGATGSIRLQERLAATNVKWSHGLFDRKIAAAATNGQIALYDIDKTGHEWARVHEHTRQVHSLAFNPIEGAWLLSGSQDATIRLWDLRAMAGGRSDMTMHSLAQFSGNSDAVRDIRWSHTRAYEFAIGTDGGVIQRWDIRKDNAPIVRTKAHEKTCNSIDWHPDGRHIVSGGVDKEVKVWDFDSADRRLKPLWTLRAPQAVMNVRWRPSVWRTGRSQSGQWQSTDIATSFDREDPRILIWDFRRPHVPRLVFDRYDLPPSALLWRSDTLLWSVGSHGIFTQSNIGTFKERDCGGPHMTAEFTPEGDILTVFTPRILDSAMLDDVHASLLRQQARALGTTAEQSESAMTGTGSFEEAAAVEPSQRRRRGKQGNAARSNTSLDTAPESGPGTETVLPLDKSMEGVTLHTSPPQEIIKIITGSRESQRMSQIKHLARNLYHMPSLQEPSNITDLHTVFKKICDHNSRIATDCGRNDIASDFLIIGQMGFSELKTRALDRAEARMVTTVPAKHWFPDIHPKHYTITESDLLPSDFTLLTPAQPSEVKPWFLSSALGKYIEIYLFSRSDEQLAAWCFLNLVPYFHLSLPEDSKCRPGREITNTNIRLAIVAQHISVLRQMRCHVEATLLLKHAVRGAFAALGGAGSGGMSSWCAKCKKPAEISSIGSCKGCRESRFYCSVCERGHTGAEVSCRNNEEGAWFIWCQRCGHSGHDKCMTDWWTATREGEDGPKEESEMKCPAIGCLCACLHVAAI